MGVWALLCISKWWLKHIRKCLHQSHNLGWMSDSQPAQKNLFLCWGTPQLGIPSYGGYLILVDLCGYHTRRIYTGHIMQKAFSYTAGTFFKNGNKSPIKEYYLKCDLSVVFKVLMYKIICSTRKSTFHTFPLLLKCWTFNSFPLSCWAAMLCCFGWSYCSFKPALRDRESDTWHQYFLTTPLAHKIMNPGLSISL